MICSTSKNLSDSERLPAFRRHAHADSTTLPISFQPGPQHVVCARGKAFWSHPGNVMYRRFIADAAPRYAAAKNKVDKSVIVGQVIEAIEATGPDACLVKKTAGKWAAVSQTFAREKISQSLRDALQSHYKSSTAFKRKRQGAVDADVDRVIQSDFFISQRIDQLSNDISSTYDEADSVISSLFFQANLDILARIKTDESLLKSVQESCSATAACANMSPSTIIRA